jgi:hypothetical protein
VLSSDQIFESEIREKRFQPTAIKNTYYNNYRWLLHYDLFDIHTQTLIKGLVWKGNLDFKKYHYI